MTTIDKEKMKQMLDDILIPAVEKHSKVLDEINEKRPDYLMRIELNLISHKKGECKNGSIRTNI